MRWTCCKQFDLLDSASRLQRKQASGKPALLVEHVSSPPAAEHAASTESSFVCAHAEYTIGNMVKRVLHIIREEANATDSETNETDYDQASTQRRRLRRARAAAG